MFTPMRKGFTDMDEIEVKVVISAIVGFMLGIVLAVVFTMLVILK